jgi:hypothetical protein
MPDIANVVDSITSTVPDFFDAFVRGGQYAIGMFVLVGVVYILRRYL